MHHIAVDRLDQPNASVELSRHGVHETIVDMHFDLDLLILGEEPRQKIRQHERHGDTRNGKSAAARDLANESGTNFYVDDWTRLHYTFFRSIQLQKTMMFVILSLVIAVAVPVVENKSGVPISALEALAKWRDENRPADLQWDSSSPPLTP